jgi:hypothetical protein
MFRPGENWVYDIFMVMVRFCLTVIAWVITITLWVFSRLKQYSGPDIRNTVIRLPKRQQQKRSYRITIKTLLTAILVVLLVIFAITAHMLMGQKYALNFALLTPFCLWGIVLVWAFSE